MDYYYADFITKKKHIACIAIPFHYQKLPPPGSGRSNQ